MTKPKWHKGEPPSIGWWPTRRSYGSTNNNRWLRWWDGKYWSTVALPGYTAFEAADSAYSRELNQDYIKWSDRWWV